jgi:riboflavin biosynthesis pyrimidine reductase
MTSARLQEGTGPPADDGSSDSGCHSEFAQTLIEHDLVDEYRLMIDPLVVGSGMRLFREGALRPVRLVESQVTMTGAILATYATAPE